MSLSASLATTPSRDGNSPGAVAHMTASPLTLTPGAGEALDFESLDLSAHLACGALDTGLGPPGLEVVCPHCRTLISVFLNHIAEAQQYRLLEDWPTP